MRILRILELYNYSELSVTKRVVRMSIVFIMEWGGYVYRIIDDWNREEIYSRRRVLGLEVCCYDLITLRLIKEGNLILGLTQENSIENSVQDHLPYILNHHGLCYYLSSLL